jgi:hypothetical protein
MFLLFFGRQEASADVGHNEMGRVAKRLMG